MLPPNATWVVLRGSVRKGNEHTVTLDPPPPSGPGPHPFTAFTDSTFGPTNLDSFASPLDHTIQYTMTVEAVGEEGAYLSSVAVAPYNLSMCVELYNWVNSNSSG